MNTTSQSEIQKKPLVLIVDDLPDNLQILGNLLKKIECRVAFSTSGQKALEMVKKIDTHLILLDISMPEMDGFDVCRLLKQDPDTVHIPVIFLTASKTDSSDVIDGFRVGAVDYITKPFRESELLSRVKTHLELQKSREIILQKNQEQSELLHILCHDLSNPFNGLDSLFDLYSDEMSISEEILKQIKVSIKNGLATIDLVRTMSIIDEGENTFQPKSLNLLESILESKIILSGKLKEKNIRFDIHVDKSHYVIVEKTSFINSVLNNIFTNAIKFSFPGSAIEINSEQIEDTIVLTIKDAGIGIPTVIINDIFGVGKNIRRKGTEGELGTGFGMLLVKKFMDAYGATVNVVSKEYRDNTSEHGTSIFLHMKIG